MCGYRYNVKANIIFYDSDNFGFFCTEEKQLIKCFQTDQVCKSLITQAEVTLDNEHFDVNYAQILRNLRDGNEEGSPAKQSTDIFDLICKILNCKSTLLKLWRSIYLNTTILKSCVAIADETCVQGSTVDGDDRSSAVRRRISGADWELDKIFKFDMVDDDLYDKLNYKVSIDDSEETMPAKQLKSGPSDAMNNKYLKHSHTFKEFLTLFDQQLFDELDLMTSNTSKLRPEIRISFYIMLGLSHYFTLTHYALLTIWTKIPWFQQFFFSSYKQILQTLHNNTAMKSHLKMLNKTQPNRLTSLLKSLGYIYNSLARSAIDLALGLAVAVLIWSFTDGIHEFLLESQSYIHPSVFKKQLMMIAMNPAGIKLNYTYCGIISKLTHLICIIQNLFLGFLTEHLKILLYAYATSALLGFSFFLAILRDITNLTIFQMRAIFAFIFLIFMEHTSWFRIMWRIMRGQRENKQESRIQEQYYQPYMRYIALLLEVVLLTLYPTIIFFCIWSLLIYLSSTLFEVAVEAVQVLVSSVPLGSMLASSSLNKLTPRVLQIKHIFKVQEFRIVRRGAYSGWRFADLSNNIKNLSTLKRLKSILTLKTTSIVDLVLPYPRDWQGETKKDTNLESLQKAGFNSLLSELFSTFSALGSVLH